VSRQPRDRFVFRAREPLDLRGCGPMATYWLLGPAGKQAGM
jgi:hypothetical protein